MDLGLHAQTALVTGSTAGIGFAAAAGLAHEAARVILNGRSEARVDGIAAAVSCVAGGVVRSIV